MEKHPRSVTITQYDYIIRNVNDEEIDIRGHRNQYSEFDAEGRLLKEIRYNREGQFEEMTEFGYDDAGRLVHETYSPDENEVAEEKDHLWDEQGRMAKTLKRYLDGSVDTSVYEYDDQGRLTRIVTTGDDGEVEQVETMEWNNDVLVAHEVTDSEGDPLEEPDLSPLKPAGTRVAHNDQGQPVLEEDLDEEGNVVMSVRRTYNPDGRTGEVEVFIDGQGRRLSRHYVLKYEYTFYE